jgi:O-antigen ligase
VKWLGLAMVLAATAPLSLWLRGNPAEAPKAWMLLGLLPFVMTFSHTTMAFISWSEWPGYVRGAEFSILDGLALALYFSLPGGSRPLPFRLAMASYFLATLLSAMQAQVPMAAFFYSWQLARMFLVYAVVAKASAVDPRVTSALLTGMAGGLILQALFCIFQRFEGVLQAGGTFGHQNLLGLISHFIVFPFFALLLAGQRGWLPIAVGIAGVIVQLLTTSRATVGLAGFGYLAIFLLSAWRQWTPRKARILLISVALAAALVPIGLSSFGQRFESEPPKETDYDERAAFERAAALMLADHPFGVGPNNYVVVANVGGYNDAAGVLTMASSEGANVHNVYRLVAAESGYTGLITFLLLLFQPLVVAFRCGWRNRGDRRGDLLLGLGVALLVVYVHSFFEWIFVASVVPYVFATVVGLVAGLASQLDYWRVRYPNGVRRSRQHLNEQVGRVAGSGTQAAKVSAGFGTAKFDAS